MIWVRSGHISVFHLEVYFEISVVNELLHQYRHKLSEVFLEEASALGECVFDCFILWVVIGHSLLENLSKERSYLDDGGLENFFVVAVRNSDDD